ncbi:hypothetical protein H7F15_15730 [Pontibacter sp. Tf4]|uniref:MutS-related protein n=1 Tax=Pontibacter sp. Tf4 TaxID=2761620 RepID=UPI001627E42A|nr:hypothetical protein [Pontibacter sp. Tf4]MBB6612495.1 hypothetical protein [Pontibacter sp. Tf4]
MMQVQDLRLKEEVLPFFNFTNNSHSEARLLYLLQHAPDTQTEVAERVAIVHGMLVNWAVLKDFTYHKLDLLEVHAFMETIAGTGYRESRLKSWLRFKVYDAERHQLQAKLVQLILLLNGLQQQYLNRLRSAAFPDKFKAELIAAVRFLEVLHLETMANVVRENSFRTTHVVEFSERLAALAPTKVRRFWEFFFQFEAYWSIARSMQTHGFTFSDFNNEVLEITDFYHPLIKYPVKNSVRFTEEQNVLLLTGANMAGKSTLLKAVSLCVYLARVGFPVPAAACTVPFFSAVVLAINLNDNLRDGYSHFMTELKNLKAVLQVSHNGSKCFAVFDEIFRGTNVDDALEITRTTINGLAGRKGSHFMVSTHMLQLEEQLYPETSESVQKCYIECSLQNGEPTFTYKLQNGWSQLKIGRILFEKEGLPQLLEHELPAQL